MLGPSNKKANILKQKDICSRKTREDGTKTPNREWAAS